VRKRVKKDVLSLLKIAPELLNPVNYSLNFS
jgi:hypothetical protein